MLLIRVHPGMRLQPGHLKGYLHALFQPVNQRLQRHLNGVICLQRRAHGGKEMANRLGELKKGGDFNVSKES